MNGYPMKIGLVLSGGGGKGAYQVGVWKGLMEFGLDKYITGVSGTSAGALNMALFAQRDYYKAEKAWLSISNEKILTTKQGNLFETIRNITTDKKLPEIIMQLLANGVFTRDGLMEMIEKFLEPDLVKDSDLDLYACCCELPLLNVEYFKLNGLPQEKIVKILLASSAIPVVFKPESIDGRVYTDGGVRDILPVKPLYDEGYRRFITVSLDPHRRVDRSKFPEAKFIEIMPEPNGDFSFEDTFDFSDAGAARRIQRGYEDAIRILQLRLRKKLPDQQKNNV